MNTYLFLSITFFIISILTANYKTKYLYSSLLNAFFIFGYLAITIIYFSIDYFTGVGINEAVLFTVEAGLSRAGFGEYVPLIAVTALCFIIIFALSYLYFRIVNNCMYPKPKKLKGTVHNVFLLLAFLSHPFTLDLYSIFESRYTTQSTDFDHYYKKPHISDQKTNGMNLIYIYAESLEKTYFDKSLFPGLMQNLRELKKESTEFTDIHQVPGIGWTIAGMTATQCGIPLFTVSGENSILQTVADENNFKTSIRKDENKFLTRDTGENSMQNMDTFFKGATCLGDILSNLDYHLVLMQGSSVGFSGVRQLYETHNFNEIYDRGDLVRSLKDNTYVNGWGLYDDSLFYMVYRKFVNLSKVKQPFGLFMATMDTHPPGKSISKLCKDIPYGNGDNPMLNAVHCTDKLITDFIKKIQKSKYGKDTIIVLTSDHLAMKNTAINLLLKKDRRDLFLIFNPRVKKYTVIKKKGSMFDVAPTILSILGIETDIGLGRNLFTKISLYASFKNFNKKLLSWRDAILALWQFPKLPKSYDINISEQRVYIGNNSYKYPVLFKINKNHELQPIFEAFSPKKLFMYLPEFEPTQKFIWVDTCIKQKLFLNANVSGDICAAQGSLSSENIEVKSLINERTTIDTVQLLANTEYNSVLYHERMSKQRKLLDYTVPNEGEVEIISSRHPVYTTIPNVIRISNQKFRSSRGLNIFTVNDKGEYMTQQFDVYSSQDAANQFLGTMKHIIDQKKFWAVMVHGAVKNTYPGYKEKLTKMGFRLLATLNNRVAYIAYPDKNGKIHEDSNEDTLHKIIPFYIKSLSDEERKAIKSVKKESLRRSKKEKHNRAKQYSHDTTRFIAHAGGLIDGFTYTDSLEALNQNYAKGFKLFELDIIKTSDHIFVAAHDWKHWQKDTGYKGDLPPTLEIFKQYKIRGRYTPLAISDINKWFKKHSDAILITDKINEPLEFSKKFIDKKRLMMELFSWEAVEKGVSSGILSPMPTGNLLKTKNVLEKLHSLGIKDIAISRRMIYSYKTLLKKISEKGIHMYAFHVNYDKGKDEKFVLCKENDIFYGMYADTWDFNDNDPCTEKTGK